MTDTGPVTSTGHLALAAENIRMAMHVDGPATPPECYDQIGALVDITSRLQQHLDRVAEALDKAAQDERLRSVDPHLTPAQVALHTRGAAFHVRSIAGEKLRALVRELNMAWTETSGLTLADDEPVDATIVDDGELLTGIQPATDVDISPEELERRTSVPHIDTDRG